MTLITKYLVSDLLRKIFIITFGFTVLFSFFSFIAELENLNTYEIKLERIFIRKSLTLRALFMMLSQLPHLLVACGALLP